MNRLMVCALFAALWMPVPGIAQTAATAPTKIAWIGLDQTVFSCDEGKAQFADVQKFVDAKNSELDTLRKEAESLKNQLNVQGSKLTDEARADLEEQIEAKDTALQRFQQDTQKEIDNRRVRAYNYIGKRLQQVLEKVAKEKGLSGILYVNASRDAWVDPSLIITEEVVKSYNETYPVSASKAPAAPAPAKKP